MPSRARPAAGPAPSDPEPSHPVPGDEGGHCGLAGLVLAAGAGSRFGQPKALVHDEAGLPWLASACELLGSAGCTTVTVVLGAEAARARELVPAGVAVVEAADWQQGMAASLRAGLAAASTSSAQAALITLVDLPGMPPAVPARLLAGFDFSGPGDAALATALRQAVYRGLPGHPVLIGRSHWPDLSNGLAGDVGARPYLRSHGVLEVECGDLWHGDDVDRPR